MDMTTTKTQMHRLLCVAALFAFLTGCESFECGRYRGFVENNEKYNELVEWADSKIFARAIVAEDVAHFGLVGPGRRRLQGRGGRSYQPPSLIDVEIRLIGEDPYNPNAIFLGRSSFKGLIVSRGEVDAVIPLSSVQPDEVLSKNGRAALICRPFR
jgi:hypothetical protein